MKVTNPLYRGFSGKMGGLMFFQAYGNTYAKRILKQSYNKMATPAQAPERNRFTEAHRYAQAIIADPQQKAIYTTKAEGKRSAYAEAMSEFLRRR